MRIASAAAAALAAALSIAAPAQASEPARGSDADRSCLTEAIYFEAAATAESQSAVAHVILNRARDGRFPTSVCGVVKQGCQFSYRCSGRSLALRDKVKRSGAQKAAAAVLSGADDPTNGALYFHSAKARPGGFFKKRPRVGEIGGNVFYR